MSNIIEITDFNASELDVYARISEIQLLNRAEPEKGIFICLLYTSLRHLDVKNKKIVSILSGGNMDVITMSSVVQHGLIQRDRIFTVSVLIPDKPGELVRVASVIAENQGNVIKLDHNQFVSTNRNAAVELRITMEAFGTDHKNQIVAALEKAGCKPRVVRAIL